MRDAAAEFDDFKTALHIALGIGDNLAMLDRQHMRQLVHIGLDHFLELEEDPRAPLRVGCCPCRLRCQCRVDRLVEQSRIAKIDLALDAAVVWVENIALTSGLCGAASGQNMGNRAH